MTKRVYVPSGQYPHGTVAYNTYSNVAGGAHGPRRISQIGFGFGALAIATIGFVGSLNTVDYRQSKPVYPRLDDGGTGYIRSEGEWKPAKKIVNGKAVAGFSSSSPRFFPVVPRVASLGFAGGITSTAKILAVEPLASACSSATIATSSSQAFGHTGRASCVGTNGFTDSSAHAEKIIAVDWLSVDELIVALEEM